MNNFWEHLKEGGFLTTSGPPSSKFGGIYTIQKDENKVFWLVLSQKENAPLLTPKQAQQIKIKLNLGEENIIILNGLGAQNCIGDNGKIDIKSNAYACILKVKLLSTN